MRTHTRSSVLPISLALAAVLAPFAQAAKADDAAGASAQTSDQLTLAEVVVTALRRASGELTTPISKGERRRAGTRVANAVLGRSAAISAFTAIRCNSAW